MSNQINQLPAVYIIELHKYATTVGDGWREALMHDWARAGTQVRGVEYSLLHKIRNTVGPSALETYEFPDIMPKV